MLSKTVLIATLMSALLGLPAIALAGSGPAGDAHDAVVEALSTGNIDAIDDVLTDHGVIVFSLGERRAHMPLREWLGHFSGMVESGTRVSVVDRQISGGGSEDTAWTFAIQELAWTPAGATEPASTAVWYTTEVWERDGDDWKLAHVHHGLAPEGDSDE